MFAGVLNVRSSFDIEDLVNYGRVVAGVNVGPLVTDFLRTAVTAQEFEEFEVYNALRVYAASPGADSSRIWGDWRDAFRSSLVRLFMRP